MPMLTTRGVVALAVVLLVVCGGVAAYLHFHKPAPQAPAEVPAAPVAAASTSEVIGTSVQGRAITAYTYGTGPTHLLFVGGMHGGYEWNSVLLAYQFMDYLAANPDAVPAGLSVTVVPAANPDGVFAYIGKEGRFTAADVPAGADTAGVGRKNAHDVDLNRNFGCHWAPTSTWQNKPESAGTAAFSEPEAQAIRDLAVKLQPAAVVFWHSASGTVYAAECGGGASDADLALMNAYAKAAGYKTSAVFDAYPITGDSEGWLASIGIPAVTVELTTHDAVEWDKNLAGIKALFALYAPAS
ncbi:MAG TPA: M14 family metallopeptidase [Candidatus Paceibacterota bacterium]